MKILGLVNARGGSKGVPGKNIKPLGGKPLIAWSIGAGLGSRLLSKVVVSTDCEKIAAAAREAGAEVPFLRPAELATNTAKQIDAVIHAVKFMEDRDGRYDYVCILQPTCPLRSSEDIDGALDLLTSSDADSVITVTDVGGRHPMTLYRKGADSCISPYLTSDGAGVLRQNFEDLYWRTGGVYAMKRDIVVERRSLYGDDVRGYEVPEERCFNIDGPFDWALCEAYVGYLERKKAAA